MKQHSSSPTWFGMLYLIWIFTFHPSIAQKNGPRVHPSVVLKRGSPLKALNCFEILGFLSFAIHAHMLEIDGRHDYNQSFGGRVNKNDGKKKTFFWRIRQNHPWGFQWSANSRHPTCSKMNAPKPAEKISFPQFFPGSSEYFWISTESPKLFPSSDLRIQVLEIQCNRQRISFATPTRLSTKTVLSIRFVLVASAATQPAPLVLLDFLLGMAENIPGAFSICHFIPV